MRYSFSTPSFTLSLFMGHGLCELALMRSSRTTILFSLPFSKGA